MALKNLEKAFQGFFKKITKSATISCEPNGAYFVSILTEFHQEIKPIPSKKNIVGLDYSSKELFVSSENQREKAPKFFSRYQENLAKEQRKLSRKVKGSSN